MKKIYGASNYESTKLALDYFGTKWGEKYSYAYKSWVNTIENLNKLIRVFRFFKNSVFFPLFLDLNHCLMNNTSKEEQFFKKDKIIFINNLISNVE